MPINKKYIAEFKENAVYHVYNRTNNKEALFLSDDNRFYFLKQYSKYLFPFFETYAWCLMDNHFHFLVKVRTEKSILLHLKNKNKDDLKEFEKDFIQSKLTLNDLLEKEWRRFFISYSMAFNKQHNRNGNLFTRIFKRLAIETESHFTQVIIYIHANAVKHKLSKDILSYKWSSFHSYLSNKETLLEKNVVLEWFGGIEGFKKAHNLEVTTCLEDDYEIEDESA